MEPLSVPPPSGGEHGLLYQIEFGGQAMAVLPRLVTQSLFPGGDPGRSSGCNRRCR